MVSSSKVSNIASAIAFVCACADVEEAGTTTASDVLTSTATAFLKEMIAYVTVNWIYNIHREHSLGDFCLRRCWGLFCPHISQGAASRKSCSTSRNYSWSCGNNFPEHFFGLFTVRGDFGHGKASLPVSSQMVSVKYWKFRNRANRWQLLTSCWRVICPWSRVLGDNTTLRTDITWSKSQSFLHITHIRYYK